MDCPCLTLYVDPAAAIGFAVLFALVFAIWLIGELRDEKSSTRAHWSEGGPVFVVGGWLGWLLTRPFVWGWVVVKVLFVIVVGILIAWPILALLKSADFVVGRILRGWRWLNQRVDWYGLKHSLRARTSWWLWRKWTSDLPICAWCSRRAGDMHSCLNDPIRHGVPGLMPAEHPYAWYCGRCATLVRALDPSWDDELDTLCPVCAGKREPAQAPRWVRGRDVGAALTLLPPFVDDDTASGNVSAAEETTEDGWRAAGQQMTP